MPDPELQQTDTLNQLHELIIGRDFIKAIDFAVLQLGAETSEKAAKRIVRMLGRAILGAVEKGVPQDDKVIDELFDAEMSLQQRRLASICLLRALAAAPNQFLDLSIRHRAFSMFDSSLGEIYRELKLDTRSQTHEKEATLRAYVHDAERELENALVEVERVQESRWEFLAHSRSEFPRLLRKYGAILQPFLARELSGAQLDGIFASVREYLESDEATALHTYERARAVLGAYSDKAYEQGTRYAGYFFKLAAHLSGICDRKFDQSAAGKPAKLTARSSEKRYPFYFNNKIINLALVLDNVGPGYARQVSCRLTTDGSAEVRRGELYLGSLGVGNITIEFPVQMTNFVTSMMVELTWEWSNFDGSSGAGSTLLELHGQPIGVDWDALAFEEPYKLEPVTTEKELVGRKEILTQLTAKAYAASVGSACIWGQRRVGKTSIARTLMTRLKSDATSKIVVLFLETGEYNHEEPHRTIEQLGTKICRQVALADPRLANIERPKFEGALSPLSDFIDEVSLIAPELRFVVILDEFDNVPISLYRRGTTGEAFFATIRSLSHKNGLGFVLVGGERMRYLFDCQGQALNKFQLIRVDYFDRSKHWEDYRDLVTRPTDGSLQFGDSALVRIYLEAAGNPYFTVLICRQLFNMMVSRRDAYVTEREAAEAVELTAQEASTTNFQHFWDDGIVETGVAAEEISMRRRYVLLALADAMGGGQRATRIAIAAAAQVYGLDRRSVQNELSEFIQRDVLIEEDGQVGCKAPLFARWLKTVGPRQISTTYTEAEALRIYREQQDAAAVQAAEIMALLARWSPYKGRSISTDHVRGWLEQFGKKTDQRLMFRLLQNLSFYSEDDIRAKMAVANGIITRGVVDRRTHKQVKKWPGVIVSYLDGPGKSGSRFAKLYIDENQIYQENLVERTQLPEVLRKKEIVDALVFIDDFVGTGLSFQEYMEKLFSECGDILRQRKIKVFFIAVAGFERGKQAIENYIEDKHFDIRVHICDTLDSSYVCFGEKSRVFPLEEERMRAMELAERKGVLLCKPAPLGYGNSQALVVFSHNCPNNTLPILWEQNKDWFPLFRRD